MSNKNKIYQISWEERRSRRNWR